MSNEFIKKFVNDGKVTAFMNGTPFSTAIDEASSTDEVLSIICTDTKNPNHKFMLWVTQEERKTTFNWRGGNHGKMDVVYDADRNMYVGKYSSNSPDQQESNNYTGSFILDLNGE